METEHAHAAIEALLEEQRTFPPPEKFRAGAVISDEEVYRRAEEDFERLWAELAGEFSGWCKQPTKTMDRKPPDAAGRLPTTGSVSRRATRAISPTRNSSERCPDSRTAFAASASARATASGSTWGWFRSFPSPCSPAHASALRTSWSSAASPRSR